MIVSLTSFKMQMSEPSQLFQREFELSYKEATGRTSCNWITDNRTGKLRLLMERDLQLQAMSCRGLRGLDVLNKGQETG